MRFNKGTVSGQAAIEFVLLGIVIVIALIYITMVELGSDSPASGTEKGSVEFKQTRTGTVEGKYIDSAGYGKHYYVTVRNNGYEADHEVSLAEAYNGMENPYLLANRYIDIMPKVAEEVAKPLTAVDSIKMYGSGNAQKLVKETTAIVDQVASGLKDSTGVDLPSLLSGLLAKSDMDAGSAESLAD